MAYGAPVCPARSGGVRLLFAMFVMTCLRAWQEVCCTMEFELLVSIIAWFTGSFVTGICGLGAAIVAMPGMMLIMPVQKVVLISCLSALGLTMGMAVYYRRHCPWKTVLWMLAGVVPGGLVGIAVLRNFPAAVLEMIVGSMLIFCIIGMQLLHNRVHLENTRRNALITGFIGGVVGTSITIDGPIIALYGLFIGLSPMQMLGITSGFFLVRNGVSDIMQAAAGLYTKEILSCAMWCIPASLAGFVLSIPLVRRIKVDTFRTVVKAIILIAGIMCLARGIWSL